MCLLERSDVEAMEAAVAEAWDLEAARSHQALSGLLDSGFLLPASLDELKIAEDLYRQSRHHKQAVTLTICPTLACNFGCDYCFQGQDKPSAGMREDVQDAICALYERILDEQPEINLVQFMWYGGEPLIKKNIIFSLSERLNEITRRRRVNSTASMVSNGYMLDREVASRLYDLGLRMVQVTLDGSQPFHDERRALHSKKGTYDAIVSNMREWIEDVHIKVNLRVNIDERNKEGIGTLIDDLAARGFAGRENFKMYFAPVESVTRGCHSVADKMLRKRQYGGLEADLYVKAFRQGLADLPYPAYFIGVCSALRANDFIVVPCGSVHKCWDTVSFADQKIGTIFDLDGLFRNKSIEQQTWDSFDPFSHQTCRNCKILPNCAGFCAHKFINATETVGEASLPCPSLKYSIHEKLVHKAVAEGHITAADYDPDMIRTDPAELCTEAFRKEDYAAYRDKDSKLRRGRLVALNVIQD
ncbi:radical SAM protein [Sorangium sp. So ce134]